jgi:hypothetical protein
MPALTSVNCLVVEKLRNGVNNGMYGFVAAVGPWITNMFIGTTRW